MVGELSAMVGGVPSMMWKVCVVDCAQLRGSFTCTVKLKVPIGLNCELQVKTFPVWFWVMERFWMVEVGVRTERWTALISVLSVMVTRMFVGLPRVCDVGLIVMV